MAVKTLVLPAYVEELSAALIKKLAGAQIKHEQVLRDRYRFIVVWKKFDRMGHPERQSMVWNIADETLSKPELLKVAMILTLGMKDIPVE